METYEPTKHQIIKEIIQMESSNFYAEISRNLNCLVHLTSAAQYSAQVMRQLAQDFLLDLVSFLIGQGMSW